MISTLNSYVNEYELFFTILSGGRIGVSFNIGNMEHVVKKILQTGLCQNIFDHKKTSSLLK
jgi:hypothetical protein